MQLVTWLHGLPITGAKDFLALIKDSPRATVIHNLEGCEQIALLNLATQGYLPERPLQGLGGHPIREQLLPFVLIFERKLFPRLTYMKNLITRIHDWAEDIPRNTKNIITYDPLPDSENGNGLYRTLPRQTPHNLHLRPTVKRGIFDNPYAHLPGEQPCKDLEHDDLLELFRHDEKRGLSKILLEQGTKIEVPTEDEQGVAFWIAGEVSICHVGSLDFRAEFPGSILDKGMWKQTWSRADMDITWRLPPALRKRQPAVHMILNTQGYTPWHLPQHGSHWLRLQPRGAWIYGSHVLKDDEQNRVYGWRKAFSTINMGSKRLCRQDFTMSLAIENHMTNEDLGPEASKQDWTDLETLQEQLRWWKETIYSLGHPAKERNRWSQVPPRVQDRKSPRPRHWGRAGKWKKEVSCFHARTRVRMFTKDKRAPEYERMDKLVKGDQLWTRRYKRNILGPSQGHVSTVECVMTFACPPEGQPMVEVEGNFLTPEHHVARGNGTWSTAGQLTPPGSESTTQLARIVYNIKLQKGDHIELGSRIYAATLGARFDTAGSEEEPTYSEEDSRYLQDLPGYSSGHIHWAPGATSVDRHGMPVSNRPTDPPSRIGTSTLLDKDILEIILCTQKAEQKWIDTHSMLRRVHSIWNHAARSIYLEFTNNIPGIQTLEEENSWRSTFYREREEVRDRIRSLREPTCNRPLDHTKSERHLRSTPNLLRYPRHPGRGDENTPMADIP